MKANAQLLMSLMVLRMMRKMPVCLLPESDGPSSLRSYSSNTANEKVTLLCDSPSKADANFRAPDLIREKFSGNPDIKGTYKNSRTIMRKFKVQQILSNINDTINRKKVVSTSFILIRDLK